MLDKSCVEFIDELGSKAPTPGGGSAAALVGALGIALGTMVGELTTGKKKFAEHEQEVLRLIEDSRALTEKMKAAVYEDVRAFEPLSAAYRLPASSEADRSRRQQMIQDSLQEAAEAPLRLAELCVQALRVLEGCVHIENRLAISDVGTGAAFCQAALKGAQLNVLINLRSMQDQKLKAAMKNRLNKAVEEGNALANAVYGRVEELCM